MYVCLFLCLSLSIYIHTLNCNFAVQKICCCHCYLQTTETGLQALESWTTEEHKQSILSNIEKLPQMVPRMRKKKL